MAMTDARLTLANLAKIEFPGRTVRLTDGGRVMFDGEEYLARDEVFGTVAAVEEIEASMGDMAPAGGFSMFPSPDADLADIVTPTLQNSRVRLWQVEIGADLVTAEPVESAELLADQLIDVPFWSPADWRIDFDTMERSERLFLRSEGNVCSSAFHKSVWPGEKGFDNCTDEKGQVAWGTEGAPGGTVRGNTFRGGGGRSTSDRTVSHL